MVNLIGKRELLGAGLGLAGDAMLTRAMAQAGAKPVVANGDKPRTRPQVVQRQAKTTKLFLTPPSYPNAIAIDPDGRGFWVQEQRKDSKQEAAWLLDWNGKVLHMVPTNSTDTSGMTVGGGYVWSGANGAGGGPGKPPTNGIYQTDMNGKQISLRQVPFGPANDGGSCHGLAWEGNKLWIYASRLETLMRVDPKSWQVDYEIECARGYEREHGIEYDNGSIWQAYGNQKKDVPNYEGYTPGLIKYDIKTGRVVENVVFVPGSCDIHDLAIHNGQMYGVDAGWHPGWPELPAYQQPGFPPLTSPSGGYVYRIDLV